jgi:hypothetical protein
VAAFDQRIGHVAADETRAAGHQDPHAGEHSARL